MSLLDLTSVFFVGRSAVLLEVVDKLLQKMRIRVEHDLVASERNLRLGHVRRIACCTAPKANLPLTIYSPVQAQRQVLLFILLSVTLTEGLAFSQEAAPETSPSVTVTGKVPPPYHDPYTYLEPDSLLESSMSGSVYRNHFFAFSYRLPQGWTAEDIQITRKRDKGETVRAEPPGSSLTAQTVKILGPVILLNATRVDAANHERLAVPFVSIAANPSHEPLSVGSIRHSLDSTESARQAHGIRLLSEPIETSISSHSFFRTDFREIQNGVTIWKTFYRTSIHGGELIITFCASSKAELDQLLATAQSFAFDAS
jgi:hypothetical protein